MNAGTANGVFWETHGRGVPLFMGPPPMASFGAVAGAAGEAARAGYLRGLTDRYRVLLIDYPSIGRSADVPPDDLTASRVVADLLAAADAAGFERFIFWGYSWCGAAALQLAAAAPERLLGLVIGGWPPLGGPFANVRAGARANLADPPASSRAVLRRPEQYRQWLTFYDSIDESREAAIARDIRCPRLVFAGERGDDVSGGVSLPIASSIRARRTELEALGWRVRFIPNQEHGVVMMPAVVLPVVRPFLDALADSGEGETA